VGLKLIDAWGSRASAWRPGQAAWPTGLAPLRERNFRLLFTAQAVSLLGDGMTSVALAFAVLDLTGSASDLGYVLAARAIPIVVFLLAGGVFADRLSRRSVMLGADLARFGAQGCLAALLVSGRAQVSQLLALAGVLGVATAFFNPASSGLLPSVVTAERLQAANGLRGVAVAGAGVAGPAAAAAIVTVAGAGWAIAADAATFAMSAAFLSQLHLPPRLRLPARPFLNDLREGFSAVRTRAWLWSIVLCAGLVNLMFGCSVLGPLVAKRSLGGAGSWALVLAAFAAGSFVGGVTAMHLRPRRPLLIACSGLSLLALSPALLALELPAACVAGAALVGGISSMLFNALWETSLQRQIPNALLSRVSAYDWLGSAALTPLGFAIAGPVAATVGVERSLWCAAAVIGVAALLPLAVPAVRGLRNEDAAPQADRSVGSRRAPALAPGSTRGRRRCPSRSSDATSAGPIHWGDAASPDSSRTQATPDQRSQ
jgi:hypothetical protein